MYWERLDSESGQEIKESFILRPEMEDKAAE